MHRTKRVWMFAAVLIALAGLAAPLSSAQDQSDEKPEATDYWIGVRCAEVPEVLRAQLDLPEGQGVLIDQVIADAPAQQAGLKTFDVIVSVNDKQVSDPPEVAEAVAKADGDELKIEFLRGGKKQTVMIKPSPRPGSLLPQQRDRRSVQQWLERIGEGPTSWRFLHPGMVLPPGASVAPSLPGDMTVTIEKHGDKPAKVTVKQGDKTWQAAEDSLDKLPDEARNYVQRMLGLAAFEMRYWPPQPSEPVAVPGGFSHDPAGQALEQRLNRRLDEMNRQIERLRKMVEKQGQGDQ